MNRPVMVTMATTRSAVKFSVATRGSADVGITWDKVIADVVRAPDRTRQVMSGVAGDLARVAAISAGIFALLRLDGV